MIWKIFFWFGAGLFVLLIDIELGGGYKHKTPLLFGKLC